ncbi:class I SAM-dependent methyltransferase [Bacillus sp. FJAT-50079]|nr:class I SAM-dependent methyltransferase [Bacillus sp. FJAT-50079]MBS4209828.1 class I SAM-dependent methyltransferase [Bacillus sp. FJAT-50079]
MGEGSWLEQAKTSWDNKAAYWHQNSMNMWETGSRKEIIPFMTKYISAGSKIADIGCGDGYGSKLLHDHGYLVVGMDLSEEMIRIAKRQQKDHLTFQTADVQNIPYDAGTFDGVMSINCLEWTKSPLEALNELHRITKVGGHACIGILGPTAKPRENSYPRLYGKKAICNTMMPWEFERLASENGWRKIAEKGVYKRGVTEAVVGPLANELKQALTFMQLFLLVRVDK